MKNLVTYLSLVAAATFWGANFVVGKLAIGVMAPMSVIAWRFLMAGALMLFLLWAQEPRTAATVRQNLRIYGVLGLLGIFGMNTLLFVGLQYTSAVDASMIMATNPLVTVILSAMFLQETIRWRQGVGMAVSFIGVVFVLTGGHWGQMGALGGGDLLILGGNMAWALYGVLGRRYVKNASPLQTSAVTMAIGAVCLLPFVSVHHAAASATLVVQAWLAIVFMAACGSVLSYLWWTRGIAQIGANRTAIFFNVVPVSTMVMAAFMGQSILPGQLAGAAIVIVGVVLATTKAPSAAAKPTVETP